MGGIITYGYKKDEDSVKILMEAALEEHTKQKQEYDAKLQETVLKPKSLEVFPSKNKYKVGKWYIQGYQGDLFKTGYWERTPSTVSELESILKKIEEVVDQYIADCQEVYDSNLPIIEDNKKVLQQVTLFMQEVGVPDTYSHSFYKTSRSRNKTTETHRAGYLQDLDRLIKVTQPPVPKRDSLLESPRNKYKVLLSEVRKKEREEEEKRKTEEDVHKVALLRAKYTPDNPHSDAHTLREEILKKDKYLQLAYWLERNRGDWSGGYNHANAGLDGFEVDADNETDVAIHADIQACIESGYEGGIDGRIFRDTTWNYSVLYGMVEDEVLLSDLEQLTSWYDFT